MCNTILKAMNSPYDKNYWRAAKLELDILGCNKQFWKIV